MKLQPSCRVGDASTMGQSPRTAAAVVWSWSELRRQAVRQALWCPENREYCEPDIAHLSVTAPASSSRGQKMFHFCRSPRGVQSFREPMDIIEILEL